MSDFGLPGNSKGAPPISIGADLQSSGLLHLLDTEISAALADSERQGWSSWALIAGVASLLWLTVVQLGPSVPMWGRVGLVYLLWSLGRQAVLDVRGIVNVPQRPAEPRFWVSNRWLGSSRISLIVQNLHYATIFLLVALFLQQIPSLIGKLLLAMYLLSFVAGILVFVVSYVPFPIPVGLQFGRSQSIVTFSLGVLVLLVDGAGVAAVVYTLIPFDMRNQLLDLKIGSLLFAATYLVIQLSSQGAVGPLVESLRVIRRNLLLGKITTQDAAHQAEIAISGFHVSDLLQSDIQLYLQTQAQFANEIQIVAQSIDAIHMLQLPADRVVGSS